MELYGLKDKGGQRNGDDSADLNGNLSQGGHILLGEAILDYQAPLSEVDHYQRTVKRENFVRLFLSHEYNVDMFVATHLYGTISSLTTEMPTDELEDILGTSARDLSISFIKRV